MSRYIKKTLKPYGVVMDTDPNTLGEEVYTDVENMRFINGAAEKLGGEREVFSTTGQATYLQFNGNHETPIWIYAGDGILRATDFITDKDIEGTALSSGTNWDSCLFNGFPILNNSLDTPRYWGNDYSTPTATANLPAFPASTTCQAVRSFRSFLVALNITESATEQPNRLIWSDSSDAGALPASWDITDPTTLAGDTYLTDDRGEIVDGHQLRDVFVIYKTHSIYLMTLVGGTSVMRIDKVQVNSGLLAKNCVCEFMGRHFIVSDGDVLLFDGQDVESIAEKRVRDEIFDNIDPVSYHKTSVVRDDKRSEILISYPERGASKPTRCAIWNWNDNQWSFRSLPDTYHIASGLTNMVSSPVINTLTNTIDSYTNIINGFSNNPTVDTLASASTLAIHTLDETSDIDGAAMPSKLEKLTIDLGDEASVKIIKAVIPRITANAGTKIYIRLGSQDSPDEQISWTSEVLYVVGRDREAHIFIKGRYISIRMRTQDLYMNWKCHGFTFDVAQSGKY